MLYDPVGNLLSETTGQSSTCGNAHALATTYAFDAANRQINIIESYSTSPQRISTMVYDIARRVPSATDPRGHTTTYAFDPLNRQTQVVDDVESRAKLTMTMLDDAAHNVTSETTGQSSKGS